MGKSYVAFLWHFHQPPYAHPESGGRDILLPWVRLHAARDYYQMGYLVASCPGVRVTFNFTPVLLDQFDAYLNRGARDRLMALSLRDVASLSPAEQDALIAASFDVDFGTQIRGHPRYLKLYRKYCRREGFSTQEIWDAVALFNLAWVGEVFRTRRFELETGEVLDLREYVERCNGYTPADIEAIIAAQLEIMRAIVPLYRSLWQEGRIELTTSPFYHPILPLLHDTDKAIIDRPGSRYPRRFSFPADAKEQIRRGLAAFEGVFGRRPVGMWPPEGAVGEDIVSYFADEGIRWIASDEGVLARSGRYGYDVGRPEVLFRPYRVGNGDVVAFFRHRGLSDAIGFVYQNWRDPQHAAADFIKNLQSLAAAAASRSVRDQIISVILDGENAWGAYQKHGVPFLTALYKLLAENGIVRTVQFGQYLQGVPELDIPPHPAASCDAASPLAYASWIDEAGSFQGNDLGTWVGEPEENRAWELLGQARERLNGIPESQRRAAYQFILAAEASDWFWWYGDDQGGGAEETFDLLFRSYIKAVYDTIGTTPPAELDQPIAPRRVIWRPDVPITLVPGDLLVVEWPTPGGVRFGVNGWQQPRQVPLVPAHGVMGQRQGLYRAQLLRIDESINRVEFTFFDEKGRWLGYDFFIPVARDLV